MGRSYDDTGACSCCSGKVVLHNMIPQIISLGPIPINSFGLMIALALLAGMERLSTSFKRNGIRPELAEKYVLVGGFGGLIAARLWYILDHWSEVKDDLFGALLSGSGFVFYGGFLVSVVTLLILAHRDKLKISAFADSVGPTLALAYAIGRLGCQLAGDGDYGIPTTSFIGMSYATGVVPTPPGVLAYPTPFFESVMSLGILWLLNKAEVGSNWKQPYARLGLYLSMISVERFAVEFMRRNPRILYGFSEAQWIAIGLIVVGLVLSFRAKLVRSSA